MSTAIAVRGAALPAQSFSDMVQMGEQLVRTGFLPAHLRTGAQVAAVILTGRELGMEPMRAVRSLSLVKGKVIESADSQLARFKADGGRAQFKVLTEQEAVLWLRHPNGDEHVESFSMADARNAGLAGSDTYKKFPKAMLRSRVITAGLKSVGWEGAIGNYDPDEVKGTPLDTTDAQAVAEARVEPTVHDGTDVSGMTIEEARAMTVGKSKRKLGDMSLDELDKLSAWAQEKGNQRIAWAAELLLAENGAELADEDVELLDGSAPIMEDAA